MGEPFRDAETIYREDIERLPDAVKLRLVALIEGDVYPAHQRARARLTDLSGLGREVWDDVDTSEYVDRLPRS